MGPLMLEVNPDVMSVFRVYDSHILKFLFGRRRWMMPAAYRVRDCLREAFRRWHAEAHQKAGDQINTLALEDPEYDPSWGSKFLRSRQAAMMKMDLNANDRAALDLGLMFA